MMNQLPNEILLEVGKHAQRDDKSALHSLSLTCRQLHTVLSPLIYSYISCSNFTESFIGLIIRMWEQPALARQVHRLDLCWSQCSQYDPPAFNMSHEIKNFVELALEETFTPEEKEQKELWSKHLYGVGGLCAEAWLGLFLIRLPNLRILEFQHENSELISDILLKAAKRQQPFHQTPPFPHLQEIRACVGWGASWIDSDFLNPFFYFPAVRKIYGTAIGEKNEKAVVVRENLPKKCPVQTVIVEEGYWCRGMLNWLGLCTDLQHICITIEIQADEYELDEEDQFDASEFRLALLPFTTTLRTIRIRYADSYKDHVIDEKEDIEVPFGSFKDFIFLETLTVRHDHLMKLRDDSTIDWHMHTLTEILPHCLLNLEIIDVMVDYHLQLSSELLKILRPGRCPINIQRLKLCICLADSDELGDMFRDLELECQAANVYLEIEIS